ncbi:hypothetical protein [Taibaiella koreensis]|uniref:hypothetical protein n=1 Tax=Taibaiella koreensis TaxID=1268548 RepID=UPI000E599440|nr:hypothetical protein [Taibaiella koreensis]
MKSFLTISLVLCALTGRAQELFPLSEPASNIPKGALGVRLYSEAYNEVGQLRMMSSLRLMYGLTPRLSVYLTGIASNHHGRKMPIEFPFHNTPERGAHYPYKFNGVHLYAKYRFLSLDAERRHFRMAAYGEGTYVNTTHHETEPDLEMGDNKGLGVGLITTYLKGRFAVSLTAGGILPAVYEGGSPDPIESLPDVPVRVQYGKALTYSLSFGYLLLPRKYANYDQVNVNLYLEFHGKAFQTAKVDIFAGQANEYFLDPSRYPTALQKGYYVDVSPGVQVILKSNLRIDLSATFSSMGISYARLYPVFQVGIQRYFFW